MLEIGKTQTLKIVRFSEHGAHLGETAADGETVLLPGKEIPAGAKVGQEIEVFLYLDSQARPIATTRRAGLQMGELAVLEVKDSTPIGAFLDWGLDKDLFLPFKEQSGKVRPGMRVPAMLYTDKSGRLCATMRIEKYLSADGIFARDAQVWGTVYRVNPDFGAFVAVENRYFGLIQSKDLVEMPHIGDRIEARVTRVRSDGKLNLCPKKKAYKQMDDDAQKLEEILERRGGYLALTDKTEPEQIRHETGMTKNAFKRAVGRLFREEKIRLEPDGIRRC